MIYRKVRDYLKGLYYTWMIRHGYLLRGRQMVVTARVYRAKTGKWEKPRVLAVGPKSTFTPGVTSGNDRDSN